MTDWLMESCEEIDAGVFSGDVLLDDARREMLKDYIRRWDAEIARTEPFVKLTPSGAVMVGPLTASYDLSAEQAARAEQKAELLRLAEIYADKSEFVTAESNAAARAAFVAALEKL